MCREAKCNTCGKTTWAGCGNHVDAVMRNVPKSNQCTCSRETGSAKGSWLSRLFGK